MAKGSEALETPKKGETKGETKGEKKAPKKGMRLAETHIRHLHDGTHHIIHHYEDANHLPHHHTPEFSAASKQDLADHLDQNLPDGPNDGAAAEGQAAPTDPAAAAAGAGPGAGADPGAGMPGE